MIDIANVSVDPEFDALLPPLTEVERLELCKSIVRDGFTDPIIVWLGHGAIVDGNNRYRIWKQFHEGEPNRTPDIVEKHFPDRDAVKEWMIRRQLGRRNLTDAQRVQVALQLKPALQEQARDKQRVGGTGKVKQTFVEPILVNQEIADVAGVSKETVRKVEAVLNNGSPAVKAAMLSGDKSQQISVHAAYKSIADGPKPSATNEPESSSGPLETGPAEVLDHDPSIDESDLLVVLQRAWNKSSKKTRAAFREWAESVAIEKFKGEGKGIERAHEAIGRLRSIPYGDPFRARGYEIVADFIAANPPKVRANSGVTE